MDPASSGGMSLWIATAVAVATGAVGATGYYVLREAPAPEPEVAAPAPEEVPEPVVVAQPDPQPEPEAPALRAPVFDVVRIDADGSGLVAGLAEPRADVFVLIDGEEIGEAVADGAGRFAAFVTVPASTETRVMSLMSRLDGAEVASAATVIISPVLPEPASEPESKPEPLSEAELVAEAELEAVPETEPEVAEAPVPEPEPAREPSAVAEAAQEEEVAEETVVATTSPAVSPPAPLEVPSVAAPEAPEIAVLEETPPEEEAVAEAAPEPEVVQAEPDTTAADASSEPEPVIVEAAPQPEPGSEPEAPRLLLADDQGITVLQSPEAMTNVALDTISYDDAGEVSLGGRALGEGFVRIYLDDQPITTSRISSNGTWRTGLPEVDTGVYTLRVDEVDAEGGVTSRIETPFRREDPEVVAELAATAPEVTGPVEQTVMTVQPGSTLWAMAREIYGEGQLYVKVFEANRDRIRNPDLIYPGQVFDMPD